MAERGGFEPPEPFGSHAFQACTFDHSDISPKVLELVIFYTKSVYQNIYFLSSRVVHFAV